jgi:hypothetical protein
MSGPTIIYFGASPTTIIFQSSTNFNGTAQTGTPTLSPGVYVFPVQAAGGLYNMHELLGNGDPITVLNINYTGGGTLEVERVLDIVPGDPTSTVGTISGSGDLQFKPGELVLNKGIQLSLSSSGATNPVVAITAMLSSAGWVA